MQDIKKRILVLLNKRIKNPQQWDSVYNSKDMTQLYACKNCYTIIEGSPGYIKKINHHMCHSSNVSMVGYVGGSQMVNNKQKWDAIKNKIRREDICIYCKINNSNGFSNTELVSRYSDLYDIVYRVIRDDSNDKYYCVIHVLDIKTSDILLKDSVVIRYCPSCGRKLKEHKR